MARRSGSTKNGSTANLGFEAKLWLPGDKVRCIIGAAEYKRHVLGSAPFNHSDSFRRDDDVRWQCSEARWTGSPESEHNSAHQYGVPPRGNANFAWVQHFIHHLAPHGIAGFVLANGSMSCNQSSEGDICRGGYHDVWR